MTDHEPREQYVKELEGKLSAFETIFENILFQLDDSGKRQMLKALDDTLKALPGLAESDPAFHRGFENAMHQIRVHMQ